MKYAPLAFLLIATPTHAMTDNEARGWIHDNYPICCEHESCVSVSKSRVSQNGHWYDVDWRGYSVRFHRVDAKPSPNENYYICQEDYDPVPRCFFTPRMGS